VKLLLRDLAINWTPVVGGGRYNPHWLHSALGQRFPLAFEQAHAVPSRAA
jgi:hypothetical protein